MFESRRKGGADNVKRPSVFLVIGYRFISVDTVCVAVSDTVVNGVVDQYKSRFI
jgi:hypothetical protein